MTIEMLVYIQVQWTYTCTSEFVNSWMYLLPCNFKECLG